MKITLITSNQKRHNHFVNLLSNYCDKLYVIQENDTIFPGVLDGIYNSNNIIKNYFRNVFKAQEKIFGKKNYFINSKNISLLPIKFGDLNKLNLKNISNFLKSDIYIVYGSSYIKGPLVKFLVKRKAINIHLGLSPFYRGTDCNFWALHDGNPHMVGATIHYLTDGLDNGDILYHAMPKFYSNPFMLTMSSVISSQYSICERIKKKNLFKMNSIIQDKKVQIRYSKKIDFNNNVIKVFNKNFKSIKKFKYNINILKNPYFFKD